MRYAFADCILDTDTRTLVRAGEPAPTEPQVFDLLHLLLRHAGTVVSRDTMIKEIWQGRIVSESAISARIAAARRVVGDDGKAQAVIRTVARRGLMLVAEVSGNASSQTAPRPRAIENQRIRYARNVDGYSLAYAVIGDGPKVLAMRPTMTCDLEAERHIPAEQEFFNDLAAQFTVLRFNQLGSGQSERSVAEFDFARQADNSAAVADAAGFDRFAILSESGGCLAAIHFAARYPERVSRLVIVGGYAEGAARRGEAQGGAAIRSMIAEGWDQPDSPFATAFLTTYFPEGPLDTVRDLVAMMQASCSTETRLGFRDAIDAVSVVDLLPLVRCPTLILHARDEAVHPLSEAQKLAAGIPDAELVILETANHIPLPGNAVWDTYVQTLTAFLAG